MLCRSPHGERGLKLYHYIYQNKKLFGRSPHGERGLKFNATVAANPYIGRSPHGERGLKSLEEYHHHIRLSRSPHGERGLKFVANLYYTSPNPSLSSRRAWIEMLTRKNSLLIFTVALLTESVD